MATMATYDGFSDINYPKVRFWDMNLDEKKFEDFSYFCLINSTQEAFNFTINDSVEFLEALNYLIDNFSELNPIDYPEYTKGDFDFQSRLVGFSCCFVFNNRYSFIPIVELSGTDAHSIVTAIALVA